MITSQVWLPASLLLVFALSRWPGLMPENFSAAYAFAFCGGVFFPGTMAWWLPLGGLFLTGTLLNVFYYDVPALDGYTLVTYLSFAALVGLGRFFRKRQSIWILVLGGLAGAIVFYILTNTFSWLYEPTQPYPKTLLGWIQALTQGTAGWPQTWVFFRNSLLSSGLFTALFAAAAKLAEAAEPVEDPEGSGASEPESTQEPEAVAPGKE